MSFFKGSYKKRRHGKSHLINEILYTWYGKCASATICVDGSLLREDAMEIKEKVNKEELNDFNATNGWLESWKKLCGEGNEVSTQTVKAWIERLPELYRGYEPKNILNLDELGLFFKALPEKGLVEKSKKTKGGKKSKQRLTAMFIVAADGSYVFEPTVIWRSKLPRCFKSLKDPSRPMGVHYFWNKKAWMNSDLMETILHRLDRKMSAENRNVVLFLDNATFHPETLQPTLTNIKLLFSPKNTTSRLQPLDAGIIRNFKQKYRKLLLRYVITRVDEGKTASQICEDVHVLKAISWLQTA